MSDNDRRSEIEARLADGHYLRAAAHDPAVAFVLAEKDLEWCVSRIAALTAERDEARAEGVRQGMEKAAGLCDRHAEAHRERPPEHGGLAIARALGGAARFIREAAALPTPAPDGAGDRDAEVGKNVRALVESGEGWAHRIELLRGIGRDGKRVYRVEGIRADCTRDTLDAAIRDAAARLGEGGTER